MSTAELTSLSKPKQTYTEAIKTTDATLNSPDPATWSTLGCSSSGYSGFFFDRIAPIYSNDPSHCPLTQQGIDILTV